ncbi:MAG: ABC transporter ATP-binding protein [Oscillospiraceae bacterium]|nr:ABC transporter ATP-binding protein [Oscillospiraceae bacterium]
MLKVDNVNVFYGHIHAIRDVSIEAKDSQIVSIVGANGAGKSTLMMTIAGVLKKSSGSISFDGELLPAEPHKILAKGVCLVPERRRLYANLTVRENLLAGAYLRKDKAAIQEDMEEMFSLFPILKQRFKQYAGTLSGGEQQMLAIARGLMSRPKLLMLDEPSLGLAPMLVQQVFDTICNVRDRGTTIFMTEQNASDALAISDYAYVLETGRITLSGSGKEVLENPEVQKAYLGIKQEQS